MIILPSDFAPIILAFQPLMLNRTWQHAVVLLAGAILAPGKRTVCSVLRIMGRRQESDFQNYHRVLNRASWNLRRGSQILLGLLVQHFAPDGPLLFGIDDTIERRWGPKIRARGIYRDPVRSSRSHMVKASGLRWLSLMLLVPIPWAHRVWALPFLTSLAPSERYYSAKKRKTKTLLDWARQQAFQLRRWLPNRQLILVADGAFAALEFLKQLRTASIVCITRLRLDAQLFEPAPARDPGRRGRPRLKGHRLPSLQQRLLDRKTRWNRHIVQGWYGRSERAIEFCTGTAIWYHGGLPPAPIRWVLIRDPEQHFDPLALLSTDQTATPLEIVACYLRRWQVGVSSQGHIVQSVRDRPGLRDSSLVAWEAPWRESKTAEPSDNILRKECAQRTRLQRAVNADVASLHAIPVAETVDNARKQKELAETSPKRQLSPAGYQRRHGVKDDVETGEALGARRRNLVEEMPAITASGKCWHRHQGGGSGRSTDDGRAAKRARREGPGPVSTPSVKARQG